MTRNCNVCERARLEADAEGKAGYAMCRACLFEAKSAFRQTIVVAGGSGLDYIGGEMLGIRRQATVEISFEDGQGRGPEDVIGTYTAVERDADYRARILEHLDRGQVTE